MHFQSCYKDILTSWCSLLGLLPFSFSLSYHFFFQFSGVNFVFVFFTPQPLGAVGVLFSPMVGGCPVGRAGGGKKFVRAVSQKL